MTSGSEGKSLSFLNYKELQNVAMIFNLPANLKHGQMVKMLQARHDGDEDTVRKILAQYKEERCRRKMSGSEWRPSSSKRRKMMQSGVPEDKLQEYCSSVLNQILKEHSKTKSRTLPPLRSKAELECAPSIVKLVTEATSTQVEPESTQQSQSILRTLLQTPVPSSVSEDYAPQEPTVIELVPRAEPSPQVLDVLQDYTPDTFSMPRFWGRADTSTFTCYRSPLCATYASTPTPAQETADDAPWWPTEDVQAPECFRQNNKISYPLIYNYLTSTEDQLWEPLATSSPNSDKPDDLLPLLNVVSQVSCRYVEQGCVRGWMQGASEQAEHEQVCEFQPISCPLQYCTWSNQLKNLNSHLRETHRAEIMKRSEKSEVIFLHELRARQRLVFLRDVNKKLFVLTVSCQGHVLHAAVQAVPVYNSEKVTLVKAVLEVVGNDGKPRSWRGKIPPLYDPLCTIWSTGQCLTIDPSEIGVYAGSSLVLHSKITAYVAKNKK